MEGDLGGYLRRCWKLEGPEWMEQNNIDSGGAAGGLAEGKL